MRIPRTKICKECGIEYKTREKNQLCCSRQCSNKYQGKLRKSTLCEDGISLSEKYSIKAANVKKQNGYFENKEVKEKQRLNLAKIKQTEKFKESYEKSIKRRLKKDEGGLNEFQKATQKALKTKIKNNLVTPLEKKGDFERYKYLVWFFTNKNDIDSLENAEKRSRAGVDGAFHLDHKYSIYDGFNNNVPPEIIGNIENLVFIPWKENVSKNFSSSISLNELFNICNISIMEYFPENYKEIKKSLNTAEKMNDTSVKCKYCGFKTTIGNHNRWHGENCKHKESNNGKI